MTDRHIVVHVFDERNLKLAENLIARTLTDHGINFQTDVKPHEYECDCSNCSGESKALGDMERGIHEAETGYRE